MEIQQLTLLNVQMHFKVQSSVKGVKNLAHTMYYSRISKIETH